MCSVKPLYQFGVSKERLSRAVQIIQASRDKVSHETCIDIVFELGFGDAISYSPAGKFQLDLTDLQLIAVAAAIAAVAESGGQQVLREAAS